MIKFFRRIRQKLIGEGNMKKYLIYAVGEILLVMVGILLALQVNNWNETRKDRKIEKDTLEGIRSDLTQDSLNLSHLLNRYQQRVTKYKLVDTTFHVFPMVQVPLKDSVIRYLDLFRRPPSFRTHNATYNSLLMDGQTRLLRNKQLFGKIQKVYDFRLKALQSMYQEIKEIERKVNWNRVHEKEKIRLKKDISDLSILNEWNYLHGAMQVYCINLSLLKDEINEVLQNIQEELQ